MDQGLMLSTIFYICGCFYAIFGAYIVAYNAKSGTSKLFMVVTSSMAIWSFSYAISNSAPTAESSAFWRCFSVFGWGVFYSVLIHFVLILTNFKIRFDKRIVHFALYFPSFLNIMLFAPFGLIAKKQYKMVPSDFGWRNIFPSNIGWFWVNIYHILSSAVFLFFLIGWWRNLEPKSPLKRQVTYLLISILLPLIAGSITDIMPGYLGVTRIPNIAIIFLMFPTTVLYTTLKRHGILLDRKKAEFSPSDTGVSEEESRTRLFETASAIFTIGSVASFFSGFFLGKGNLSTELLLSAAILILGILLRFVPSISKNHSTQNTLFLIAGILGMSAFLISNINTGAVTVWTVYIIFLLYSVVLNSNFHSYTFFITALLTQVLIWIIYPNANAVIDNSEYLKRIFVIALSYFGVNYLTNEYALKLQGYQKFSKERETLEKISSSFISIDTQNAREKTDEMFKMCAEILDFDNAFLFAYDATYEYATIVNMYMKEADNKSFPLHPGARFKTADFPEAADLISRKTPLKSEDVESISVDKSGYQRNLFLSRGIRSFYASPISADNRVTGFFVIEYKDTGENKFAGNKLNFLTILSNILGDAHNKLQYERMLYNIAYFDESTKLANRNMFKRKLAEIMSDSKEDKKIAVFDIELENLRMINDTFGHAVGEQVMIESAKILKSLLDECCYVSRTGEGEFAVALPDIESTEEIEECTEKLLSSFSHPISTESGVEALFVIVGIGISVYPEHGRDADTLLKNADLAGYEARNTERDYVFYNDKMQSDISETTLLTNKLFRSLENKEFSLEYQPQISCETGKAVGFEALLRWTTDDNTRIPPNRFIPMLEQTGLIYDVGLWVLEEALKEHRKLVEKGFSPLRVSVNLSVVQFEGEDFISDFTRVIKGSGVDPEYIELEITESLFSKDPTEVLEKLFKLKELGIKIAIDDFGSGYSSLNRLKLVPFDRIKIDKSIIDNIDLDEKSAPITKTIILLAEAFKAGITAEGVETKEQAEFLKSIFCDEIQGYYYSRPLTSEALEEFLRNEAG